MNPTHPLRTFLDRLFPRARRQRVALPPEERLALWANVSDHDPALRAMQQLLDDVIEENAGQALALTTPTALLETNRLAAALALSILHRIEYERAQAGLWRDRKNQ